MGRKSMENKKKKEELPEELIEEILLRLPVKEELPEELIEEILLRLPVKSLLRFKCVSKSWLSLISNPHFAKSHFELAATPTHKLIYIRSCGSEAESIDLDASLLHHDSASPNPVSPLPSSSNDLYIMGSCRGFILLFSYSDLILWNPSTRVHKKLSISAISMSDMNLSDIVFLRGFGYEASTDDYLLVIASCDTSVPDSKTHIEIFSLRTNSWKEKIVGTHVPYFTTLRKSGLFYNGAIHSFVFCDDTFAEVIIAFDLIQRNLTEIPLPDGLNINRFISHYCNLSVVGGCFSICDWKDTVEIWVMKEYKVQSSWTKSIVVSPYEFRTRYFSPLHFTKGGELVAIDGPGRLLKFNEKGELIELRAYRDDPRHCREAMYTESLLSLCSDPPGEVREDDQQ